MNNSDSIESLEIQPTDQNHLRSFAACLILSLSYLYFIIASAIELPFVNGDELIFFKYDDHSVCTNNGFYGATMIMGRALLALFYCQLGKFVYQLDDFSILRTTAFVITTSAMAGTMMVLRNLRLGSCVAFALSAAIFTLPGILYYILCAASAAPSPSPLVALVGYAVITNITPDDLRARPFSFKKVGWFLLAVLLLIASANFVQAGLCFFLVPTAAMLLFTSAEKWPDTRLRFLRDSVTFVTGTGLYYLVHRLIIVPLRLYLDPDKQEKDLGGYQVVMPNTWSDKFDVFNIVNDRSLHLWYLPYNHELSKSVLYFLCLGMLMSLIAFIYKMIKSHDSAERRSLCFYAIQFPPAFVALLIMVNLVSVVARFAAPRVMYPYQAVLVLMVFWAFTSTIKWLPGKLRQTVILGGALLLMMISGVLGQRTVFYTAGNDQLAWALVRAKIAPRMDYLYAVHFIEYPVHDILAQTYTNTPIVSGSMESVMRSLAPLATNELIKGNLLDHRDMLRRGVDGLQTFVTMSKPGEPTTAALPGSTFIDLNDFVALPLADSEIFYSHMFTGGNSPFFEAPVQKWKPAPTEISIPYKNNLLSGTATASTPNAAKLIDGIMDSASMWNAGIAGWWKIDFGAGQTKSIAQYRLYGWDSATNGPTKWTLDGSNDDVNWIVLDMQKNVIWQDGEVKGFSISKPAAYRYYRLNILAPGKGSQARLVEMEMIKSNDKD